MRRTKTIEIAGLPVTISEIPVSKVFSLLDGEVPILKLSPLEAGEKFKELLPLAFEGDFEALLAGNIFYDDMQAIYAAFKETNPAFFAVAQGMGLAEALANFLKTVLQNFSSRLLSSLNTGMAPNFGNMDTDIS